MYYEQQYQAVLQRIQNLDTFKLHKIVPTGDRVEIADGLEVSPSAIAQSLILRPDAAATTAMEISVQIFEWGRHVARAQRVWEMRERELRSFKARQIVDAKKENPKLALAAIEAAYRILPEYEKRSVLLEEASESHNSAVAVLDGYRALRDILKASLKNPSGLDV